MERLKLLVALAALGFAVNAHAASDDLESRVTARDGWVAYRVPLIAGFDGPCCYRVRGDEKINKGCDLDKRSRSSINGHVEPEIALDGALSVYLKVERGRIERVRAVAASCPIYTATTVRWMESVDPESSVAMLSSLLDRNVGDADDHGLIALGHHAEPSAVQALISHAEPGHPLKQRGQALFWLSQLRGAESADVIARYAKTDADPQLREKAVFALSQLEDGADEALISVLRGDYPRDVKKQALFWLGQSGSPQAIAYFDAALQ